ncbi:ABC transporter ATP-binding protein [Corynebacterium choanae]|uniref:Trehalose import ATP-binding protein SugC n=1 Tax=Corynebacterium choanae TaxID=1862358 RepID=A0A3G6J9N5_9CORY|nr:ABC transporter ATP-binding protein [Corynebacterium choanae]AZA14706.1 Spermidine/putrescine import ATP-binding protein PotA [Corynebacterium choanae]
MIEFKDIEVAFDNFVAIPNMNLTIEEGQFFTLLGPSGCGKTTALRALAGLVEPTKGRIFIDGQDVTKLPSDKRQLGMVFQNYALFPTMTVRENLAFGLKVKKVGNDEIAQRVADIAREVELTDKQLDRSVAELSGGQQQRVAIARALVMRPKILLLDEPLSNLDAKLRGQLRIQLKEMQQHFGITSVYVTHDQTEALSMSDGIAVINQGRIEQVGTPREVYSASATEFVCNFIGDVNALPVPELRAQGAALDADSAYVRVERVALCDPTTPVVPGSVYFDGHVTGSRYEGVMTTYAIDIGQPKPLSVVIKDDGRLVLHPGQQVRVAIAGEDLLTYRGN